MTRSVDEWEKLTARWRVGQIVTGRIDEYVACGAFGAFVDLGVGFLGLIENPNFASDRVRHFDEPPVGATVEAVITTFDDRIQQVRLSIRPEDLARARSGEDYAWS